MDHGKDMGEVSGNPGLILKPVDSRVVTRHRPQATFRTHQDFTARGVEASDAVVLASVLSVLARMDQQAAMGDAVVVEAHLVQTKGRSEPQGLRVVSVGAVKRQRTHLRGIAGGAKRQRTDFVHVGRHRDAFRGVEETPGPGRIVPGRGGFDDQQTAVRPDVKRQRGTTRQPVCKGGNAGIGSGKGFGQARTHLVDRGQGPGGIHAHHHARTGMAEAKELRFAVHHGKRRHGGQRLTGGPCPLAGFRNRAVGQQR